MDTTSARTTVAEGAGAAESAGGDAAEGAEEADGTLFGSTFFIFLLVVLPILALGVVLIIAFRKDRDH
jgi:F0F1-type ATP synthase membrane subunit c/vacuolar-type H+-ATPase subunit K